MCSLNFNTGRLTKFTCPPPESIPPLVMHSSGTRIGRDHVIRTRPRGLGAVLLSAKQVIRVVVMRAISLIQWGAIPDHAHPVERPVVSRLSRCKRPSKGETTFIYRLRRSLNGPNLTAWRVKSVFAKSSNSSTWRAKTCRRRRSGSRRRSSPPAPGSDHLGAISSRGSQLKGTRTSSLLFTTPSKRWWRSRLSSAASSTHRRSTS